MSALVKPNSTDAAKKTIDFQSYFSLGSRFTMGYKGENNEVTALFKQIGFTHVDSEDPKDFDFIVYSGGADICPLLYGESKRQNTRYDLERDLLEVKKYKRLPSKMPKIGICRGGQLLNVLSGGSTWQHVDKHANGSKHDITFIDTGEVISVNSLHHQVMIPGDQATIMAVTTQPLASVRMSDTRIVSTFNPDEWKKDNFVEVEVLYYEGTNSLCFQAHPEYDTESTFHAFLKSLVRAFPNKDKETA